jgi:hypothetical protein
MAERPAFQRVQYAFSQRIRDPENTPPLPGIEPRRMKVYEDLFFNNLSSLLAGTFPVLHRILGRVRWDALVRDFMVRHQAHTPLFPEVPQELLRFLETERERDPDDPPFIHELAHYEWVELALQTATVELDLHGIDRDGDLLEGVPAVNPLAWPLAYSFPVHKLSPDFAPSTPPEAPTYLVVFRRLDDEVKFMEINGVTARLLELARAEAGKSGRELLLAVAAELGHPDPDAVVRGGADTLEMLRTNHVILGVHE